MTVIEIIEQYLRANGYDGLTDDDCGCSVDELFLCGTERLLGCRPAYRVRCDHHCSEAHKECMTTVPPDKQDGECILEEEE